MNIFTPIYQFRTDIDRPAYFDLFLSKIAKFIGSGVTSDRSYLMTTDITLFCLRRTLILQEFRQLDAFSLPLAATKVSAIVSRCLELGLIIGRNGATIPGFSNVLILAPPLILTKTDADLIVAILKEALTSQV